MSAVLRNHRDKFDRPARHLSQRASLFIKAAMQSIATIIAGAAGPRISADQAEGIRRDLSELAGAAASAPAATVASSGAAASMGCTVHAAEPCARH